VLIERKLVPVAETEWLLGGVLFLFPSHRNPLFSKISSKLRISWDSFSFIRNLLINSEISQTFISTFCTAAKVWHNVSFPSNKLNIIRLRINYPLEVISIIFL